jgi:stress response protein SCP2
MAVNLKKGQGISLRKDEFDLSRVTIGLGWDVVKEKKGLLKLLLSKKEADYDLDAIAFLLGKDGKVQNLGRDVTGQVTLADSDVIFFNNLRHRSGAIWLTGDNRTGDGDGDDEQIVVQLNSLDPRYESIIFVVSIYHGHQNNQDFGKVENAFIRAVDAKGKEICRYNISGDASYAQYRSMTFAQLSRQGSGWEFRAIGTPHETDRFVDLLKNYI